MVLGNGASRARGPLHSNVGWASCGVHQRRHNTEAQKLLLVLHPAARTDRVPRHALQLVAIPITASVPCRISAHQEATVAPRTAHGGLELLPRKPAPDAGKDVPMPEGSVYRHLERRRYLSH